MLVLSRKVQESIIINGNIKITVVDVRGRQVHLGFKAPKEIKIFREELICENDNGSGKNIKGLP